MNQRRIIFIFSTKRKRANSTWFSSTCCLLDNYTQCATRIIRRYWMKQQPRSAIRRHDHIRRVVDTSCSDFKIQGDWSFNIQTQYTITTLKCNEQCLSFILFRHEYFHLSHGQQQVQDSVDWVNLREYTKKGMTYNLVRKGVRIKSTPFEMYTR